MDTTRSYTAFTAIVGKSDLLTYLAVLPADSDLACVNKWSFCVQKPEACGRASCQSVCSPDDITPPHPHPQTGSSLSKHLTCLHLGT